MEHPPPFHSFQAHVLPDATEQPLSRLMEPKWAELFLQHLCQKLQKPKHAGVEDESEATAKAKAKAKAGAARKAVHAACRGCCWRGKWMPYAGEAAGCEGPSSFREFIDEEGDRD